MNGFEEFDLTPILLFLSVVGIACIIVSGINLVTGSQIVSSSDYELLQQAKKDYFVEVYQSNWSSHAPPVRKWIRLFSAGFSINDIYNTCMYIANDGNVLFDGYCYKTLDKPNQLIESCITGCKLGVPYGESEEDCRSHCEEYLIPKEHMQEPQPKAEEPVPIVWGNCDAEKKLSDRKSLDGCNFDMDLDCDGVYDATTLMNCLNIPLDIGINRNFDDNSVFSGHWECTGLSPAFKDYCDKQVWVREAK